MSLLDTLRKNLDPETFQKVTDSLGDDFNYDMVPRTRLNKVIAQRDEARRQLSSMSNNESSMEMDTDNVEAIQGSGTNMQNESTQAAPVGFSQADIDKAVQAEREEGVKKVRELQLQFATTEKLRELNFVDPNLVLSAGLIDFSKVVMDERGSITDGIEEQLQSIAKDRPYLVQSKQPVLRGTGRENAGDSFGAVTSKEDFLKLPTDQQISFKANNPELFKGFMSQI